MQMTYSDPSYSGNIINFIDNLENKTYLELGIADNTNFDGIISKHKESVDLNGRATFTGTTDKYFEEIDSSKSFDVIFIDANHDYDYVLKDFNNCIKHCKDWIAIHDMIPPTEYHTVSSQCSDSYKILHYILKERNDLSVYSMENPIYCGLTFIKMPAAELKPDDNYKIITYQEFKEELKKHKLYSKEEIKQILS